MNTQDRVVRVMLEAKEPYLRGRLKVRHDSGAKYLFRVTRLTTGAYVVTSVDFTRSDLDHILDRMTRAAVQIASHSTTATRIVGREADA